MKVSKEEGREGGRGEGKVCEEGGKERWGI